MLFLLFQASRLSGLLFLHHATLEVGHAGLCLFLCGIHRISGLCRHILDILFDSVCLAGALIIQPKLIVCDEPVSALDVSIQAQILNMLVELQKELGLSLLFISHDIGVVRFISDRIGVMYLGTLMEETETEELFEHPLHPYTEALFEAVPDPYIKRKELKGLSGEQPVRTEDFKGCAFYTRCPYATDRCKTERPELREVKPGHKVACHRYNND